MRETCFTQKKNLFLVLSSQVCEGILVFWNSVIKGWEANDDSNGRPRALYRETLCRCIARVKCPTKLISPLKASIKMLPSYSAYFLLLCCIVTGNRRENLIQFVKAALTGEWNSGLLPMQDKWYNWMFGYLSENTVERQLEQKKNSSRIGPGHERFQRAHCRLWKRHSWQGNDCWHSVSIKHRCRCSPCTQHKQLLWFIGP